MAIIVKTSDLGNQMEGDFQQKYEALQGSDPGTFLLIPCNFDS